MSYHKTLLAAGALLGFTTLTAQASLTAGVAGDESVVYSSVSGITWTGDANLLGTLESAEGFNTVVDAIIAASPRIYDTSNDFDTPSFSGYHDVSGSDFSADGTVSWFGAQAFTTYLNSISYAGSNQWALPSAGANPQYNHYQTGSQFGQLFFTELGVTNGNAIPDTSYFINEQAYVYWLGTEYALSPSVAWYFDTGSGGQGYGRKDYQFSAWVVSPGNVAAVPVPGAVWLFGSGLLALLGLTRRGATLGNSINNQSDKLPSLIALRDPLEELLVLVRISKEA